MTCIATLVLFEDTGLRLGAGGVITAALVWTWRAAREVVRRLSVGVYGCASVRRGRLRTAIITVAVVPGNRDSVRGVDRWAMP